MPHNEKNIISPDTGRKDRRPPGQTVIGDLSLLHFDGVPKFDAAAWRFKFSGLVGKPFDLTFKEFSALPMVRLYADIHCVTGWSVLETHWEGVSSRTLMDMAKAKPEAGYVMIHSSDGYTTNLALPDFLREDVVFAMKYNGELIEPEHGFPVRLVVPGLYFWKSAKWADGMEFMKHDRQGYWESRGYHNRGDPWKEERYSI
ncbi:MAG: sulfite oxidase-like oxidoreductase [Chloroflexi bacterium]|nr:sulfite oxidase-like oxidoreductase [Chloroflexota bacterium]